MKNIWKKLWGQELPPVDEVFPQVNEQSDSALDNLSNVEKFYRLYRRMEIGLFWRRFFVSLGLIVLGGFLLKGVFFAIKNNSFLACFGKDVCIYQGPKLNYPTTNPKAVLLKNGNVLVYNNGSINENEFKNSNDLNYLTSEIFDVSKNKFVKINNLRTIKIKDSKYCSDVKFISMLENSKGEVLFLDRKHPIEKYNLKNQQFTLTKENIFEFHKFRYITKYDNNHALVMSNRSLVPEYPQNSGYNTKTNKKENLYLLDLNDFSLKKLPDFQFPLKYYPLPSDIIVLSNGKIIVPVRYRKEESNDLKTSETLNLDHIEVYDSIQNKFYAYFDKDIMKDNLFILKFENNDVLFINKNFSYIYKNDSNKFAKVDKSEQKKISSSLARIGELLDKKLLMNIDALLVYRKARVIPISSEKVLITCAFDHYFDYPITMRNTITKACRNTVFYDYSKNIVKIGPTFVNAHMDSDIIKLNKNKFFVFGGRENITGEYSKRVKNVQIIKNNY